MIPGPMRFFNRGFAHRKKPGKQDGGLRLRAGQGSDVIDGSQLSTVNLQGRQFALTRRNASPHHAQRRSDASHAPAGKRGVAMQNAGKVLPSQNSRQHAHGGPGVAAIKTFAGLAEPLPAFDLKDLGAGSRSVSDGSNRASQLPEALESAGAVGSCREIG